jgi:hypothetical protein
MVQQVRAEFSSNRKYEKSELVASARRESAPAQALFYYTTERTALARKRWCSTTTSFSF